MNTKIFFAALLSLAFFVPECCYGQSKATIPAEDQVKKLTAQLRSQDWYPKSTKLRHKKVSAAFALLEKAATVSRADAKYAMLKEAQQLSDKAREWTLSREIVEQIASQYELDDSHLTDWYTTAIRQKQLHARTTELVSLFSKDAINQSNDPEIIKLWQTCEQQLVRKVQKSNSDFLQNWCFERLAGAQDFLDRHAAADESIWQGVSALVEANDIAAGVKLLANCRKPKIQEAAAKLTKNLEDYDALLQLISILSNSKDPNLQRSAKVLFQSRLQKLSIKQIAQAQEACFLNARQALSPDFLIMFSGTTGNAFVEPSSISNRQNVAYDDEQKALTSGGKFTVNYPKLPLVNFVHDIEFTAHTLNSGLRFRYGTHFANRLYFEPRDDNKIKFTHRSARGGRTTWKGSRTYKQGEKLRFKVYSICGQQYRVANDRLVSQRSAPVQWLNYQLASFGDSNLELTKSTLRSWLPGDDRAFELTVNKPDLLKCTKKPVFENDGEDIKSLIDRCSKLKDKPVRKKAFVSGDEIVMQPIESGSFKRGETKVEISKSFWISSHEINQLQWESVMKRNPASIQGNPYFPVDNVSYDDVSEYCQLLTAKEKKARRLKSGYVYRLPTENEWEYAARAGKQDDHSIGKDDFWHRGNSESRFHTVGTSQPNSWGLFDMHGNVDEFVLDQFHKRPEKAAPSETDPVAIPEGDGVRVVCRGGSWYSPVEQCTSSIRQERTMEAAPYRGFRVVLAPMINGS